MTKQDLINLITAENLSEDLKLDLVERVKTFSDQLTDNEMKTFTNELAELQAVETESALLLNQLADDVDNFIDDLDDIEDKLVDRTIKVQRNGLQAAQNLMMTE